MLKLNLEPLTLREEQIDATRSPTITDFLILCRQSPLVLVRRLHRSRRPGGSGDENGDADLSVYKKRQLLESLYGGQFTLLTSLIKPNFCIQLAHRRSTTVSLESTPFIGLQPRSHGDVVDRFIPCYALGQIQYHLYRHIIEDSFLLIK